jgi:hypothetical protein
MAKSIRAWHARLQRQSFAQKKFFSRPRLYRIASRTLGQAGGRTVVADTMKITSAMIAVVAWAGIAAVASADVECPNVIGEHAGDQASGSCIRVEGIEADSSGGLMERFERALPYALGSVHIVGPFSTGKPQSRLFFCLNHCADHRIQHTQCVLAAIQDQMYPAFGASRIHCQS